MESETRIMKLGMEEEEEEAAAAMCDWWLLTSGLTCLAALMTIYITNTLPGTNDSSHLT